MEENRLKFEEERTLSNEERLPEIYKYKSLNKKEANGTITEEEIGKLERRRNWIEYMKKNEDFSIPYHVFCKTMELNASIYKRKSKEAKLLGKKALEVLSQKYNKLNDYLTPFFADDNKDQKNVKKIDTKR